MKTKALLTLIVWVLPLAMQAQSISADHKKALHTPGPEYPMAARKAGVTGAGICQVTLGANGHVTKSVMSKSTGSELLDNNTLLWANQHWTGSPDTRVSVPIAYQLAKPAAQSGRVFTPQPPYPYEAIHARLSGHGSCRVVFGPDGRTTQASIVTSTGSGVLDNNTVKWAHDNWTGRPNTTVTVPLAYRLQ